MKRFVLSVVIVALAAFGAAADQAGDKVVVQTYKFKFKTADRAANLIKPLLGSEGSVSIQPGSNTLVVSDQGANVENISKAIADYDVPSRTFKLEIKLVAAGRVNGTPPAVPADLKDVSTKLSGVPAFEAAMVSPSGRIR